jgi:hypothetical protein
MDLRITVVNDGGSKAEDVDISVLICPALGCVAPGWTPQRAEYIDADSWHFEIPSLQPGHGKILPSLIVGNLLTATNPFAIEVDANNLSRKAWSFVFMPFRCLTNKDGSNPTVAGKPCVLPMGNPLGFEFKMEPFTNASGKSISRFNVYPVLKTEEPKTPKEEDSSENPVIVLIVLIVALIVISIIIFAIRS